MNVIVVGAGIVGCNIAYRLAASGAQVTLIESGTPGSMASATSYAWLNSNNVSYAPYHSLRCIGMNAYRELAKELGSAEWLHEVGNLHIELTDAKAAAVRERVERLRRLGYPAEVLAADELVRVEPAVRLATKPAIAAFFPSEGYIDTTPLIGQLLVRFRAAGGTLVQARVARLLRASDGTVTGVRVGDGHELVGDRVLLCVGTATNLLADAGIDLPLTGEVGASVITAPVPLPVATVLHLPELSVRSDGNGRIVLRSKDVDEIVDTSNMTVPQEGIDRLFDRARDMLALDGCALAVEEVRTAFRPRPPDGRPVVGGLPGLPGAYLVCTHSGVTLGAALGHLVTRELLDGANESLLEPFRPTRVLASMTDDVETESLSAG